MENGGETGLFRDRCIRRWDVASCARLAQPDETRDESIRGLLGISILGGLRHRYGASLDALHHAG
jgi:hypothetical protein